MRGLVAILMLSLCGVAVAAPSEHNYKAKQDDWEYTYRHREGVGTLRSVIRLGPLK